jgi:hypothetical protein
VKNGTILTLLFQIAQITGGLMATAQIRKTQKRTRAHVRKMQRIRQNKR